MTTRTHSFDRSGTATGRLIVLEGMPGAGKTTLARHLEAEGAPVLGEYTTAAGQPVPIGGHPAVDDDTAHQQNWLPKTTQAIAARRHGAAVYLDRDWLSSLAYAYSTADHDGGRLLRQRAEWAAKQLDSGALLMPGVYVIFQIDTATSLQRRRGRLRPNHPWSRPTAC